MSHLSLSKTEHFISQKLRFKKTRMQNFRELPLNKQGFILMRLSRQLRYDIVGQLTNSELVGIIDYLDPEHATALLRPLKASRRTKILETVGKQIREKIEYLLQFDPKTAGSLISLHYLEIEEDTSVKEVVALISKYERKNGKTPIILVVKDGLLLGELRINSLLAARKNEKVKKYTKKIPTLKYHQHKDDIVKTFKHHRHGKIVILNDNQSILGVIYAEDILKLVENQAAKTLREFAGIQEEEDVLDSGFKKVHYRYKWLIINLFTAFLAASVVGLFEETISKYVLLAVYLPIVAGMGGNAGTQTLAVTVRGLALKEIDLDHGKKVIVNEMIAGTINGVITGFIAAVIALTWNGDAILGAVIGLAMVVNLIIAGFFGTLIPLIMERLGKDPATSATIFITTATDVFGFMVFLGLAKLLL